VTWSAVGSGAAGSSGSGTPNTIGDTAGEVAGVTATTDATVMAAPPAIAAAAMQVANVFAVTAVLSIGPTLLQQVNSDVRVSKFAVPPGWFNRR
jgi:hypothetical protein